MIEIPESNKRAEQEYRRFLRELKRQGLTADDVPAEYADSLLALHQNALSVIWAEELNRREVKRLG